jgi:hypothetical protein
MHRSPLDRNLFQVCINLLVVYYDTHGRIENVLFFFYILDTPWDLYRRVIN